MSPVLDLPGELSALGRALGLLDASGALQLSWVEAPLDHIRAILTDSEQRAGLLDLLNDVLPPDATADLAAAGEDWHPLLAPGSASNLYVTVSHPTADTTVIGVAGTVRSQPPSGTEHPVAELSFELGLIRADSAGLHAVAATAAAPIRVQANVSLGLTGTVALDGIGLAASLAPVDGTAPELDISLRGLVVDGTAIPDPKLTSGQLDSTALSAIEALLSERLAEAAAAPGIPPELAALASHLLPVLGLGGGLPALPLHRIGHDAGAVRDWFVQVLDGTASGVPTITVWLGHLAGLFGGQFPPTGGLNPTGTEADPWIVRIAQIGVTGGIDLSVATRVSATTGTRELLVGVSVLVDAPGALARGQATVNLMALPLSGTAPPLLVPSGAVLIRAPRDPSAPLVGGTTLTVTAVQAGVRWDGSALRPMLELLGVTFENQRHDLIDLSNVDSARAAAADAAHDAIVNALGDGPGRHLAALAGILAPEDDPTSPLVQPPALVSAPTKEIARIHRTVLLDPARGWAHMLGELARLIGLDPTVSGTGVVDDPWRVTLATEGVFTVELAAWNANPSAAAGDPALLRLGLRAHAVAGPIDGAWLTELFAFELPANAAATVRMMAGQHGSLTFVGPLATPPLFGLTLGVFELDARVDWQPGGPLTPALELSNLILEGDGAQITLPTLTLPPPHGFDVSKPDLGLGVPVGDLFAALRLLLARAAQAWGGMPGFTVAGLLGLHGQLSGLPADWPLLSLPSGGGLDALLGDPLGALRAWWQQILLGLSADGTPFAWHALAWLRALVGGAIPTAPALELPAPDLDIAGSGTYDDPWRISIDDADRVQLIGWLEPAGPPAGWATAAGRALGSIPDAEGVLSAAAGLVPFAGALRGSLGDGNASDLAEALATVTAELGDGDGVVPLESQLPADPGWTIGATLIPSAHHHLPHDPAAISQITEQLDAWGPAANRAVLFMGPPFGDHTDWVDLLSAIESAHPGTTNSSAAFDLRSAPDPALVDMRSVTVAASHYTADLVDPGTGDLSSVIAQITSVVSRVRELRPSVPVLLVAHSTAGVAARAFAAANPSLVSGLITLGTPHGPAPLSALQDAAAADAVRVVSRLLGAGAVTGPVPDALSHLLSAAEGWSPGPVGQPANLLSYPLARFAGADSAPTGGVPALALAGRLPTDLTDAITSAATAIATQAATSPAPTHVAFGVRTALIADGAQPGAVSADVGVRLDAFRVRLAPGAAEPARSPHRIDVELRLERPGGWLIDAAPLTPGPGARLRRGELGITLEPGARAGAGLTATAHASLYDAAVNGLTAPLLALTDPDADRVLGALLRTLSQQAPAPGSSLAVALDGLQALGLAVSDPAGGVGLAGDALDALRTDPLPFLSGRIRPALESPGGLADLSGPGGGPWSLDSLGLPVAVTVSADPWTVTIQTAGTGGAGLDLGPGAQLDAQLTISVPSLAATVDAALTFGDASVRWTAAGASLVLSPGPWASGITLLPAPTPATLAGSLGELLPELLVSVAASAALNRAVGPAFRIGSVGRLLQSPGRWLVSPGALGDGTHLDGTRIVTLLENVAVAAGLPAMNGLPLPAGLRLSAAGTPVTITVQTDQPIAIPGPSAGSSGGVSLTVSASLDQLFHLTPGGSVTVDVPLGGSWGHVSVQFGLQASAVSLSLTPTLAGGSALEPIVLLPRFGGLGPLAADAAEALLPALLDALVAALPNPSTGLAGTAIAVADALGVHGGSPDPSFTAHAAQLRALVQPGALATLQSSTLPTALPAVWQAAGLPGTLTAATGGSGVGWSDLIAGATVTASLGWGARPELSLGVDGLNVGALTLSAVTLGYGSQGPSAGGVLAVNLPTAAQSTLGFNLAPALAINVGAAALTMTVLPLGEGSAAALSVALLPAPGVQLGAGGIGRLLEQWVLPLAARLALRSFDLAKPLWTAGPKLGDVLHGAGLLTSGGSLDLPVPLPSPHDLVLRLFTTLASTRAQLPIPETSLTLGLVSEGTATGRVGIGLGGHVDIKAGETVVSVLFGESPRLWSADSGPGIQLLLVDPTLTVSPELRLAPFGIGCAGQDGKALLDDQIVHLGSVAAYVWLDLAFGHALATSNLGGVLDLRDFGLPLSGVTGSAGSGGANPVAASLLGSDHDGGTAGSGEQSALNPGLDLIVARKPGQPVQLLRAGSPDPAPFGSQPFWIGVNRSFGPLEIDQFGFAFPPAAVEVLLDGGVSIAGLTVDADELSLTAPLNALGHPGQWSLDLKGLAVSLEAGPVSLAGGLVKQTVTVAGEPTIEYDGIVNVEIAGRGIAAVGSYSRPLDAQGQYTSLFVFVSLPFVLGGPPYLFVTGLGGGAGYNRELVAPTDVTQVKSFPLVAAIDSGVINPNDALKSMGAAMPPRRGSFWLAAGVRFTSFALVNTTAVAYVALDRGLEIGILGVSQAQIPPPQDSKPPVALASVELAIKARFSTAEGVLSVQAQLTDNSWLLSKSCQLTGGFAFFLWFQRDQFVLTLGGYHPAFNKPPEFPVVPRLGFHWAVGSGITVKGEAYFALTSSCVMAGGRLEASYDNNGIQASFVAYADFLIAWEPFHYDIDAGVTVSAGFSIKVCFFACVTISVQVSLGASVHILGPPLHGEAKIDLEVCSVTVAFGDTPQPQTFIDWKAFLAKYVSAGATDQSVASAHARGGLLSSDPTAAAPTGANAPAPGSEQRPWCFSPDFSLGVETHLPAIGYLFPGAPPPTPLVDSGGQPVPLSVDLAPMNVAAVKIVLSAQIAPVTKPTSFVQQSQLQVTPIIGHVPAAVYLITDHPVAAATTLPVLTGLTITAVSAPTGPVKLADGAGTVADPIPIATLVDTGWRMPVGLAAGSTTPALTAKPAADRQPTPALTGPAEPTTAPADPHSAPARGPRLRAVLRSPVTHGPLDMPAPRTTVTGALAFGLPRKRPRCNRDVSRALRLVSDTDQPPATAGPTRGRTLAALQFGGTGDRAPRAAVAQRALADDGIEVPVGTTHIWDLAYLGGDGAFRAEGAALRAVFLDRAGRPLAETEQAGENGLTLAPPDRAARLAVTCLGTSPVPCDAAPGAVSRAVAPPGYPAACGWQDSSLLMQVAPAALLGRGATVHLLAPLLTRRDGHRVTQAVVPAATALSGHRACETTLPPGISVLIVSLDHCGAEQPDRAPCVAALGATLGTPVRVVAGRRVFLVYEVTGGEPKELLRVSVAADAPWQLSGVVGVDGTVDEWAQELIASPGRRLVADGPLSASGTLTVTHQLEQTL